MLKSIFNKIRKRLQHGCVPVNVTKYLRKAFFIEHLWWLLLRPYINICTLMRQYIEILDLLKLKIPIQ